MVGGWWEVLIVVLLSHASADWQPNPLASSDCEQNIKNMACKRIMCSFSEHNFHYSPYVNKYQQELPQFLPLNQRSPPYNRMSLFNLSDGDIHLFMHLVSHDVRNKMRSMGEQTCEAQAGAGIEKWINGSFAEFCNDSCVNYLKDSPARRVIDTISRRSRGLISPTPGYAGTAIAFDEICKIEICQLNRMVFLDAIRGLSDAPLERPVRKASD